MSIATGTSIGPYEIVGLLGAGGMGEIYRARDPRLQRNVAIKFISGAFATDANRVRRFEQEARAAGQLSHPNILTVFDVGSFGGHPYIVSELLEGESLQRRLAAGALPWRRAAEWARQAADGLAAAHERDIVHRDMKPGNLFITNDGRIKILDFGIAKLTRSSDSTETPAGSPTDTAEGVVVGTAGYMSPEQVRGEAVDGRSDIFSLGTILYEMLSGRPAFTRETTADTMSAILKEDPAEPLPATVPSGLDRIVAHCLEKEREARFQSARDLSFALDGLVGATSATVPAVPSGASSWTRGRALPWGIVAALACGLVFAFVQWAPWRASPSAVLQYISSLGADDSLATTIANQFGDSTILSPDGKVVVFVAQEGKAGTPQLYVRDLEKLEAVPLSGTDKPIAPFFSPDGQWIGFQSGTKLKKIAVRGGAAVSLADVRELRGGTWGDDGTIVFAPVKEAGSPLLRVPSDGGTPEQLAPLAQGEVTQQWPQMLPGSKGVLYTSSTASGAVNDANIVVQSFPGGSVKVVQRGGFYGRYVRSGHLVYIHDAILFAVPFDLGRLEVTGPPVPVLQGVASNAVTGGAQFAVSDTGTLVYQRGQMFGAGAILEWLDRDGKTSPIHAAPARWSSPQFSPDGRRIALEIQDGTSDIWIEEWGSGDKLTRLTSDAAIDWKPIWTPGGQGIVFASDRGKPSTANLYSRRADGTGELNRLTDSGKAQLPGSWHPSGKYLAFEEERKLMILPMEGNDAAGWKPGTPYRFSDDSSGGTEAMFSPDGKWLAYMSNESGNIEVYVRAFPGPAGKWQISTGGGQTPTWSRTSQELFYGSGGRIMVASFTADRDTFHAETPRVWSEQRYMTKGQSRMIDLHPDGLRFAFAKDARTPIGDPLDDVVFVLNFFDQLRRLAPAP